MERGLVSVKNEATVPNIYEAVGMLSLTEKFCMEVDHRHTYQFIKKQFYLDAYLSAELQEIWSCADGSYTEVDHWSVWSLICTSCLTVSAQTYEVE